MKVWVDVCVGCECYGCGWYGCGEDWVWVFIRPHHPPPTAEALFAQLGDELKKYQDWLVLGSVDLDEFVDEALNEVQDWELNFKVRGTKAFPSHNPRLNCAPLHYHYFLPIMPSEA